MVCVFCNGGCGVFFSWEMLALSAVLAGCLGPVCLCGRWLPVSAAVAARHSPMDGLRGVLAFMVMSHHFFMSFGWYSRGTWRAPPVHLVENFGTVSVSLFFMMTAYLFLAKVQRGGVDWRRLFVSRVRRIVPLYWCVFVPIAVITLWYQWGRVGASQILRWLADWLFLFRGDALGGFRTQMLIAGVNWTLLYEWAFYLMLPLVAMLWHRRWQGAWVLLALAGGYVLTITRLPLYWLFALPLPIVVFRLPLAKAVQRFPRLMHVLMLPLTVAVWGWSSGYSYTQMLLTAVMFAFIAQGYSYGGLLHLRGLKWLGELSYSIYLTHGLVMYTLFALLKIHTFAGSTFYRFLVYYPLVFELTLGIAYLGWRYIEEPCAGSLKKAA